MCVWFSESVLEQKNQPRYCRINYNLSLVFNSITEVDDLLRKRKDFFAKSHGQRYLCPKGRKAVSGLSKQFPPPGVLPLPLNETQFILFN